MVPSCWFWNFRRVLHNFFRHNWSKSAQRCCSQIIVSVLFFALRWLRWKFPWNRDTERSRQQHKRLPKKNSSFTNAHNISQGVLWNSFLRTHTTRCIHSLSLSISFQWVHFVGPQIFCKGSTQTKPTIPIIYIPWIWTYLLKTEKFLHYFTN